MQTTTEMPTRVSVAAALAAALGALLTAEHAVLDATALLLSAKRDLQDAEDTVLRADPPLLDGKNEATRAAQLRDLTHEPWRRNVDRAEWGRIAAVSALESARATLSTWKATARLIGGEQP